MMNTATAPTTVMSPDGSALATFRDGSGPLAVLVDAAMSTHKESAKLSALLAPRFTVVTFDRRGRADSTDASPDGTDPVAREVEDIEAVIDANGGSGILFGSSSGAALALEAASRLRSKVTGVVLYEPPFIVDASRAPLAADLPARVAAEVAAGRRSSAASAFFREAIGVPGFGVAMMKLMPMWKGAKSVVHSTRYDFAVLDGLQNGTPLPAKRWAGYDIPTIVMVGSKSEKFFHTGAQALAALLPSVEYRSLEGGHHGSAVMSPAGIAEVITQRFG